METSLKKKWWIASVVGLLLIGAGISIITEASNLKFEKVSTLTWFAWGTWGLITFNTGIAIFGKAISYRTQLDWIKRRKRLNSSK
ncbi:hypothetical protein [Penaeicola halotolerans]|uniref:hypothetical protein n=1 Tax=Penaeicola halotolerans TaxID=2793196 RepID=UPI001CF9161F|nr:hypothetical protein [Penaeicola halotolerans]